MIHSFALICTAIEESVLSLATDLDIAVEYISPSLFVKLIKKQSKALLKNFIKLSNSNILDNWLKLY